ncbi:hypothetical protein RIF29_23273 [Crotalaria pallida]|uniref:Uncharacterized protein n=1 Tax=Crotalaria pallida TaxID=3830 RepID=A0AAN9F822_CROPI
MDMITLAAVIGEVTKEQKYSCDGLTSPPSGPPPNDEQENNKKHMPHESKTAPSPRECSQVESKPHCAEFVFSYGGPYYYIPGPYHQLAIPPYHAYHYYHPAPHCHCYQVPVPLQIPPSPKDNNDVSLSCDYESKCRMM